MEFGSARGRASRGGRGRGGRGGRASRGRGVCYQFANLGRCQYGANCRFSHEDTPNPQSSGGQQAFRPSSLFQKFVHEANVEFRDIRHAQRFAEAAGDLGSRDAPELLYRLTDERSARLGARRIVELVAQCRSGADLATLLAPVLKPLLEKALAAPLYRERRDSLLNEVFQVRGMEELLLDYAKNHSGDGLEALLCRFMTCCALSLFRARCSESMVGAAEALRERGVPEAARLLSILRPVPQSEPLLTLVARQRVPARGVLDVEPPGGRHDNDWKNFRDIAIVPTAEEILCEAPAWLPLAMGANQVIFDAGAALLDKHFRLLRADFVEPLRDAFASGRSSWNLRGVLGVDIGAQSWNPPSVVLELERPERIERLGRDWWDATRELGHGSLVCLCREETPRHFCTIVTREGGAKWLGHRDGARVGVRFERLSDMEDMLATLGGNGEGLHLIEVSTSYFSYEPVLRCLHRMEAVPLADELLLGERHAERLSYLPTELRAPTNVIKDGKLDLDAWSTADIVSRSTLDESQATALHHALTSRVALIQGPPGCGKTFLGALVARIVLENTEERILCVCYTNHALDQFLLDLVEQGVTDIARVGGRCKTPALEPYRVSALAIRDNGMAARNRFGAAKAALGACEERLRKTMSLLERKVGFDEIRDLLTNDEFEQLQTPGVAEAQAAGFTAVGRGGKQLKSDDTWTRWLAGESRGPSSMTSLWSLSKAARNVVAERWRREVTAPYRKLYAEEFRKYLSCYDELVACRRESQLAALRKARVIGATTTGAAKVKDMIDAADARVVLVEEAGEILEAHVLTTLTEQTRHLILIGDHKQLRPKVQHHELTVVADRGFDADRSLFERLVIDHGADLGASILLTQHRMPPEISQLIRMQTYPELLDHRDVFAKPDVKGLDGNLFFMEHNFAEDHKDDHNKSKTNRSEADLTMAVVRYMLMQGYTPRQLVVLTPYLGQLVMLRSAMRAENFAGVCAYVGDADREELLRENGFEQSATNGSEDGPRDNSVRISTVDNYQGEEADIVVASLVRCNDHGQIGFLKEPQRVNVLLSRARIGMILIGSANTIRASVKGQETWLPLFDHLEAKGRLVTGLPTRCQIHPEDTINLNEPGAFSRYRPNGGCERNCTSRLKCGHACPLKCHPVDRNHLVTECNETCRRVPPECLENHPCPKLCKDPCGPCTIAVEAELTCGHTQMVRCHDKVSNVRLEQVICQTRVNKHFETCGHHAEMPCPEARDPETLCPIICNQSLNCGHTCAGECGRCRSEDSHRACEVPCERSLFCGHRCDAVCHSEKPCGPCEKPCEIQCEHSKCPLDCACICSPCVEPCTWTCPHQGECPLVCGAPCIRLPCDKRCDKILACGHRCPSLCGEPCPGREYCRECGSKATSVVDIFEFNAYEEHDVDKDPVLVLGCGHFYATSTLDGLFDLEKAYARGEDGEWLKPMKPTSTTPASCPDCKAAITNVARYGRPRQFATLRVLEKKYKLLIEGHIHAVRSKEKPTLEEIEALVDLARRGPMNVVHQTFASIDAVDEAFPSPSPGCLVDALHLLARAHWKNEQSSESESDISNFTKAYDALDEAILLADADTLRSTATDLRLTRIEFIIHQHPFGSPARAVAERLCHDILESNKFLTNEQRAKAEKYLKLFSESLSAEEAKSVIDAMGGVRRAFGGWASHWFECPNGHPYFIDACGGAMEVSRCPECNEIVGGTNHALASENRHAHQLLRTAEIDAPEERMVGGGGYVMH